MSRLSANSDLDYLSETGNETPDPRLADEEYRERRLAEFIAWVQVFRREWPTFWAEEPRLASIALLRDVEAKAYADEFGWPSTLRALASALEPPQ